MQGFWLTLAWGLLALFALSVLVALVEFLRQGAAPPGPVESPLPTAHSLDVDLDALPDQPPAPPLPSGDPEARRAALAEVLQRLQQGAPDAPWVETTPMVLAPKARSEADPNVA